MPRPLLLIAFVLIHVQAQDGATGSNATFPEESSQSSNPSTTSLSTPPNSTSFPVETLFSSTSESIPTSPPEARESSSTSPTDEVVTVSDITSREESKLRTVKDVLPEQTTTVLPDVTATSQSISLLTTPPPTETTSPRTTIPTPTRTSLETNVTSTTTTSPTFSTIPPTTTHNATTEIPWKTGSEQQLIQLTFRAPCEASQLHDQLNSLVDTNKTHCEHFIKVQIQVQNTTALEDLIDTRQLTLPNGNWTLLRIDYLNYNASAYVPTLFAGTFFSSPELITYAVVGGVFGLAIVLVTALLCCKCCCRSRHQTDKDIPHLTLRLEDYSLTRIPRPTTLFGDGYHNGVQRQPSQPFETCVVPIDQDYGPRPDLNTFNGKRFRHRSTETDEDLYSRGSSVLSGSTERLARDFERFRAKRGNDNQVFRF